MKKPKEHPNPQVAVGYKRVSTTEQGDSGLSLLAQQAQIQRYCEYNELGLLEVCSDEATGKRREGRPGLEQALEHIKTKRARVLVVKNLRRLGRNAMAMWAVAQEIMDAGGELVLIEESLDTRTIGGQMIFIILAAVAQAEGAQISEQTKAAMVPEVLPRVGTHVDRNGKVKGPPGNPRNKMSRTTRRTIMRLRSRIVVTKSGKEAPMGYGAIAEELNALGIPTVNGGPWTKSTIVAAVQDELSRPLSELEQAS